MKPVGIVPKLPLYNTYEDDTEIVTARAESVAAEAASTTPTILLNSKTKPMSNLAFISQRGNMSSRNNKNHPNPKGSVLKINKDLYIQPQVRDSLDSSKFGSVKVQSHGSVYYDESKRSGSPNKRPKFPVKQVNRPPPSRQQTPISIYQFQSEPVFDERVSTRKPRLSPRVFRHERPSL